MTTRADCLRLDAVDPLAPLRDLFALPADVVYLDGNSLGALPRATAERVQASVTQAWGTGLIRSWNDAGWVGSPTRVGDAIAALLGADAGTVVAADSTSVNLYKVLAAALALARHDDPVRTVVLSARDSFPTDLYVAASAAGAHGGRLRFLPPEAPVAGQFSADVAVLLLTHVDYRSGRLHDLAAVQAAARAEGVRVVWDLAHSAGALPLSLCADGADFAVGCGYKYLNGGPGAPGFVFVHPRHLARMEALRITQPLPGWFGHRAPFAFEPAYTPAAGIAQFQCGTPPVLALAALECGVATLAAAAPLGGMRALRQKAKGLTDLFISLVEAECAGYGLALASPRDAAVRGNQVSFAHADGYAVMQALIARGVIGDFRAPDLLRFGVAPLYVRHVDIWDAVASLRDVLASGAWREARFARRAAVT